MSHVLLGEPFDIHGGGYDLVFPHHENEIAQSEPLLDGHTPMVNVWMHGGLLMFDGKKMSKSLGNFEPLSNLLERHDPQAIRLLFLQTGYRKPMNFTEASIESATSALERLLDAYDRLRREPAAQIVPSAHPERDLHRRRFIEALDDDLNTAAALSSLFDVVRETDTWIDSGEAAPIADFLLESMDVLGISPNERTIARSRSTSGADEVPSDLAERFKRLRSALSSVASLDGVSGDAFLNLLIETRRDAKRAKDFARADQIRKALADEGISLVDGRDGTTSWAIVQ
jgi:cysteinyl-tRNA synthetase